MSVVCILTPAVIAAWPAFSSAVVAAAAGLGYSVAEEATETMRSTSETRPVRLEIAQSELVSDTLGRNRSISVVRDGVTVTFSRDARGKASLCVTGDGHSEEALRAMGEELAQSVVQQYVYQRIKDEMAKRRFTVVEEENAEDRSIRLKVRHWEN